MTEETIAEITTPGNNGNGGENGIKPIDPPPEPEFEFIDTSILRIFSDEKGYTRATMTEKSYLDVRVIRCFPQSIPDKYWALAYADNRVIGIIADPTELTEESFSAAKENLARLYFIPEITAVYSLKEEFGAIYFEVDTDRGPRSFVAKGVREALEELEGGEIFLTDVNENRYRIREWQTLDTRSRRFLERII